MSEENKPVAETTVEPVVQQEVKPTEVKETAKVEEKVENKSSNNGSKFLIILLLVLCCCIIFIGAGAFIAVNLLNQGTRAVENAIVNELGKATGLDGLNLNSDGSASITDESGNTVNLGSKLPSNFPSDVPLYKGATESLNSSSKNSEGKNEVTAVFAITDTLSNVTSFYKSNMKSNGYTLKDEISFLGNTLTFENSKREVTISILGSDSEASVLLTIVSVEK